MAPQNNCKCYKVDNLSGPMIIKLKQEIGLKSQASNWLKWRLEICFTFIILYSFFSDCIMFHLLCLASKHHACDSGPFWISCLCTDT
jgi:hypothetical protein